MHCQSFFRVGLGSDQPTHADKSHVCGRKQQGQTTQEIRTTPHKTTSELQFEFHIKNDNVYTRLAWINK